MAGPSLVAYSDLSLPPFSSRVDLVGIENPSNVQIPSQTSLSVQLIASVAIPSAISGRR
jgi:hypothetical protein